MDWKTWLHREGYFHTNENAWFYITLEIDHTVTMDDIIKERKPKKYTDFRNLPQNTPGDTEGGITDSGGLDI
jgi:hypothetical protein